MCLRVRFSSGMMEGTTLRQTATHIAVGVFGIAAVTLVCFPLHVNFSIPAFLYLLILVLRSSAAGFASSAVVSLIAVLSLDYFFTPPILQLDVASPIDAVALATYLVTCLIITRLASEARQKALSAEHRREALARLYAVVLRLFSMEPQAVSGTGTLQVYRDVLHVEAICLYDAHTAKLATAGNATADLAERTRAAFDLGRDDTDRSSGTWIQCLQVAGRRVGAMGFQGLPDAESMAAPLAMLAAAMLERAESFQAASAAAATSQVETLRSAIVDAFAHQFKTPLAAILTAAGGIRETEITPQQLDMVELIEVETVRLGKLANRLLVTARLDRDEVQPRMEPTDLTNLVARLVDQFPTEAHQVAVRSDGAPMSVASDPELLSLAITQLVDNALRYSAPHSAVEIRLEAHEDSACVRVRNQGCAVAPGERERIFERLYRGTAAIKRAPGAGLGLYVARKIAHAHGGTLALEDYGPDRPDTTFCLKLPIYETESRNARKAS